MQILFKRSYEFGEYCRVRHIRWVILQDFKDVALMGCKIPHMGWNTVKFHKKADY